MDYYERLSLRSERFKSMFNNKLCDERSDYLSQISDLLHTMFHHEVISSKLIFSIFNKILWASWFTWNFLWFLEKNNQPRLSSLDKICKLLSLFCPSQFTLFETRIKTNNEANLQNIKWQNQFFVKKVPEIVTLGYGKNSLWHLFFILFGDFWLNT